MQESNNWNLKGIRVKPKSYKYIQENLEKEEQRNAKSWS